MLKPVQARWRPYIATKHSPRALSHSQSAPAVRRVSNSQSIVTLADLSTASMGAAMKEVLVEAFPHLHIKNLGGGTVGDIIIYRDASGTISHAEAKLFDAPFEKMLINSPRLLRIFVQHHGRTDRIDVGVLDRPWPELRLVELEPENFEVGVLTELEYVRSPITNGLSPRDHASEKNRVRPNMSFMKETALRDAAKRAKDEKDKDKEKIAVEPTRASSRNTMRKPLSELAQPNIEASPLSPSSSEGGKTVKQEMENIKSQMFALLPAKDWEEYSFFITTGLRRGGKGGQAARDQIRDDLRKFISSRGDKSKDVARLHNQYATRQRELEKSRPAWQLPLFEDLESDESESMEMVEG